MKRRTFLSFPFLSFPFLSFPFLSFPKPSREFNLEHLFSRTPKSLHKGIVHFFQVLRDLSLNLHILKGQNIHEMLTFLKNEESYPYMIDLHFDSKIKNNNTYGLILKNKKTNKIISTYGFIFYDSSNIFEDLFVNGKMIGKSKFKYYLSDDSEIQFFNRKGRVVYSSLQWVDPVYRGKNIGKHFDFFKKCYSFSLFNWDYQISHSRLLHKNYHTNDLQYEKSIPDLYVKYDNRIVSKDPLCFNFLTKEKLIA